MNSFCAFVTVVWAARSHCCWAPCCAAARRWQKRSGEEFGPDGYWKRWTMLSGSSQDGAVGGGNVYGREFTGC